MSAGSRKSSKAPAPDWSELPVGPLETISKNLTVFIDYVRFRGVCSSWRSAAKPANLPPQIPWLLLPHPFDDDEQSFFSPSDDRVYSIQLPVARGKRFYGSSQGWVVALEDTPAVSLYNPLTGAQIPLPPLTSFPIVVGFNASRVGEEYAVRYEGRNRQWMSSSYMRDSFVSNAILSSNPTPDGDCVVAVVVFDCSKLFVCRPGAETWTAVDVGFRRNIADLTLYKGGFCMMDREGKIAICDYLGPPWKTKLVPWLRRSADEESYLVESPEELYLIVRYRHGGDDGDTVGGKEYFDVFKADPNRPQKWWSMVGRMDGIALFLCENHTLFVPVGDVPGCRGNHIYYPDVFLYEEYEDNNWENGCDVGVFNRNDGSIKFLPYTWSEPCPDWRQASWIRPTLC